MNTEFTWPYKFDTSKDAWAQIRVYSLVPLLTILLMFPDFARELIYPASEGNRAMSILLLLGMWFTFSLFVFSALKPVRGTVMAKTVSVDTVNFLRLPTAGYSGTFETRNYMVVAVTPVAFSKLKDVSLTGSKDGKSPTIHLGHFNSNEAERLAAHLSAYTGIPSTDEFATANWRANKK